MAQEIELGEKIRKLTTAITELPLALGLVWEATRKWTLIWAVLLLVLGALPAAVVWLTRPLVDSLVAAVAGGTGIGRVLYWGGLMAGAMALEEALGKAIGLVRNYQSELLRDHVSSLIYRKSVEADYAFYDLSDYYDHLHRAMNDAAYRPEALLESLGSLAQNTVTLVAISALLLAYGWWLPVLLVLSTAPALAVVLYGTLRQYAWQRRVTADERRIWYYDWLLTSFEAAAEIRLFGLGDHFRKTWLGLRRRLREEKLRLERRQSLAQLAASMLAMAVTFGALAWMALRAYRGEFSLGVLALFYQALNQGQRLMRSLLDNIGKLYSNSLFLGNLFEFLQLEPRIVDPDTPRRIESTKGLVSGIRFDRVRFTYPEGRKPVLDDFSLEIPAGRIVAIVGLNGAGKSTLFKLLCRLYDVDDGSIIIDGVDIRTMRVRDLRRLITVLFQQPVQYKETASRNIALGDIEADPSMKEIIAAARAAGADEVIEGLADGYETPLGRWFEHGQELSAGQWQRIALARAFLRRAPVILLDEPTSSMDSWAEAAWMQRFRKLAAGRTAIIITHRFTTAMQADTIHVMVAGRIVESGSHHHLASIDGPYARSWAEQIRLSSL
ncbi:MAG: ABC transporter ATP-binding protein [Acidobacteriota bacterium]|nr:MAG: ABC transporter ATP-binding protein [Acidobacteriota bacterium]